MLSYRERANCEKLRIKVQLIYLLSYNREIYKSNHLLVVYIVSTANKYYLVSRLVLQPAIGLNK